jgi:hypothetical protein
MIKKRTAALVLALLSCLASETIAASQPGTTDTVFNKKFIAKIKPMMPYDQLVKIVGSQGKKVGEGKDSAAAGSYHWDGARKTVLDVKVVSGKVAEVTMRSPNRHKYALGKTGQLVDLDD